MAATTFDRIGKINDKISGKGFARRLLDRYIEAQMKKARQHVNAYLRTLDDKKLTELGYAPSEIRTIRATDATLGSII